MAELRRIQDAISCLAGGDFEIGSAAEILSETSLVTERAEADRIMRDCIILRERLQTILDARPS